MKKPGGLVFHNAGYVSILFLWFCLDRTQQVMSLLVWLGVRHTPTVQVLKKLRITGIWIRKN